MIDDSVSEWLGQLKDGQVAAAQKLWDRYSQELIAVARVKLADAPRAAADEEDVAQSVFTSICRAAALGRFQEVKSRDDLWWMLLAVTKHKVVDHIRRESAQKRGNAQVRNETDLAGSYRDEGRYALDRLIDQTPTPDFLCMLREEFDRLLEILRDDRFRMIAVSRIEGYTVPEIAAKLGIGCRSVERKLQIIRAKWSHELQLDE
jgi:RNA polymerase sigma factor (sigma-70 family)